mgnify:CR=1 FL=1
MSKKILIVDDDPIIVKLVEGFLTAHGFVVESAIGGDEGIEAVKKSKPDLIILDVQMPKMNGYTFIFELKKIVDINKIPIIVLTGKSGMEEIFKVEGVKEYMIKPLVTELLLTNIKKYIKE